MQEQRLIVDPGFVHHRKIQTILGEKGVSIINGQTADIPAATPEWQKKVLIDYIYSQIALQFCQVNSVGTLEQLLLERKGRLFCSIVKLKPCKDVDGNERAIIESEPFYESGLTVEFHITTNRISSDTLRTHLYSGGEFAIIAEQFAMNGNRIIFHPLVIGFPNLVDAETGDSLWTKYSSYYNLHIEDFDEFSCVTEHALPAEFDEMKMIAEPAFKAALGQILHESVPKDWGGETSDFMTSHLHIKGKRVRAAFLLKGPSKFSPMTIKHLGKNGDQIVRLSREPVDVLVVQHCHDITSAVIDMLRVFATQPSNPRFYCLVDGRESLRILNAFALTTWAKNKSTKS